MADFEALITKALASQDAGSAPVRQAVYQSSRNALERIISANASMNDDAAQLKRYELEAAIEKIEASYVPPPEPAPVVSKPEMSGESGPLSAADGGIDELSGNPVLVGEDDPLYEIQQILLNGKRPGPKPAQVPVEEHSPAPAAEALLGAEPQTPEPDQQFSAQTAAPEISSYSPGTEVAEDILPGAEPEPQPELADHVAGSPDLAGMAGNEQSSFPDLQDDLGHPDNLEPFTPAGVQEDNPAGPVPIGFTQRRKKQRIGLWVILIVIILALMVWLGFRLFAGLQDGSLLNTGNGGNPNTVASDVNGENYITVLQPADLSSLIVDGRGTAEITNQSNTQMIRIKSVRSQSNLEQAADPILIRLRPGILEQIRNTRVTIEIFASSGSSQQAQFSVSCQFANGSDCGRKRFVAGVQPQASVFEFDFANVTDINADYFLTLNTDTTGNASLNGEGDILDIVYVRLKTASAP